MRRASAVVLMSSIAITGVACVRETPYQRALALQEGPSRAEISRSLRDPNWKLSCLAARACVRNWVPECSPELERLALDSPCVLASLVTGCSSTGRAVLAKIAAAAARNTEIASAVEACPSADGLLAIRAHLLPPLPTSERVAALEALNEEPEPRDAASIELQRGRNALERENARLAAIELQRKKTAQRLLDESKKAELRGDLVRALQLLQVAETAGAQDDAFASTLRANAAKEGRKHIRAAIQFAKQGRLEQATEKAEEAARFGVEKDDVFLTAYSVAEDKRAAAELADRKRNPEYWRMPLLAAIIDEIAVQEVWTANGAYGGACNSYWDMYVAARERTCNLFALARKSLPPKSQRELAVRMSRHVRPHEIYTLQALVNMKFKKCVVVRRCS